MNITGLEIDGYGVWNGLKLEGLSGGLNVLYGPNEAGKTTLLQFVRSALYGFSPERRRYLPPVRGGRPGGSIDVAGANGRFRLDRHDDQRHQEQLTLTAADGTRQGEHLVKVLLSNVDEAIYNNIFAVGLREMQELGTLSDSEAAELLYRLTAGLDRVSLVEVMQELETSRNRILHPHGEPSQLVELLRHREQLRQEIAGLGDLTRRYARLAGARDRLERELTRLEEDNSRTEDQARVVELAITLRERWAQRTALDDQLAALGPSAALPEGAVDRLDALNARLRKHQARLKELQERRQQTRAEAAELPINEALWSQAPRIQALQEQQPWINTLQTQIGELEAEISAVEADLASERERLGLSGHAESDALPIVSAGSLSGLRAPARALKQCRRRLRDAKHEQQEANRKAQSLAQQIVSALSARDESDLTAAIEGAGSRVSQLRRRVQIDERLDQMTRCQVELEEQGRRLVDRQLLPVWVLLGLGSVFVLGVVLVMAGLFMPDSITGSVGWAMAVLGLVGSGGAGLGKVILERSNARQLEACQRHINMLQLQIDQAKEERDALDHQLPSGGGPIQSRLNKAEEDLAALEELVPLDARRTAARQEAEAAAERANQATQDLAAARRRWPEALAAAGLPDGLAPKQVRQLTQRCRQIGQMHRRLDDRREELARRRRELDSLLARIDQLVADTGVALTGGDSADRLSQLAQALSREEANVERRTALKRQARQLRRKAAKHEEALSRLKHRRRRLLREADARDEQEFRQRALEVARAGVLRKERDALSREIAAAVGQQCSERAVGEQLEGATSQQLEARRDQLLERLAILEKELKERLEKRGQLAEQLKVLAEDKQPALKQLELATVEKRLEEAIARWQVLAVTGRTLDEIRATYEQQRQPETLQEASGYLERLTRGRYRRVWTPLGEDVLRVDDAEGNSLPVEVLSRGAREQLFLSLRLALAASYARRGAALPLVLDDVLVNFDTERAKAAAAVLRDFAAAGHQVLVFTCHGHLLKLFKSLKVPVCHLPANDEAEPAPVVFHQPPKPKRRRSKRPDPLPPQLAEEPQSKPPADEIAPFDDEPVEDETTQDETSDAGIFVPPEEDDYDEDDHQWEEVDDEEEDDDQWEEVDDDDEGYEHDPYEDDDTAEAA